VCLAFVVLAGVCARSFQPAVAQETKPLHGAAALDQLKRDGQYDSLQAAMEQARLSVQRETATPLRRWAWHAPNPSAGYDAYVTEAGVSIAINDKSVVSLHLRSLGYGAALHGVAAGEVNGDGQSITIKRNNVREWFVNTADGLEHGFTLDEPPSSARRKGLPLRLAMQVGAGWQAVADESGHHVTLRNADGQAVDYGKLVVRDARGVNLAARLIVVDEQVVIEVEDHDAEYPLTIDPLFTLLATFFAPDGAASDFFGSAIALDGNTAVVGAFWHNGARGAAYVFVRNGTLWTFQQKLSAPDGAASDQFGNAVALSGNTALIGAHSGPNGTRANQGAAYVFVRSGTVWTFQQRLNANSNLNEMDFGAAVALDGDTALVGAAGFSTSPTAITGTAYVFTRSGTSQSAVWTQQQQLIPSDIGHLNRCGAAVALDGDTALVGSPGASNGLSERGSAAVFTRNGTTWKEQKILRTTDAFEGDHFGERVALGGDTAVIGAPDYGTGSAEVGKVFIFRRGADWVETDPIPNPDPQVGGRFGASLALGGDRLVVGATLDLIVPGADQRSAYVFARSNIGWQLMRQLNVGLGSLEDRFGYAVALDGDMVLVGVPRGDAAFIDQGAVGVFLLHDNRHVEQQRPTAADGAEGDEFGTAVALAGNTLVVGAPKHTVTRNGQGAVFVFTRNGTTWQFQKKLFADDAVVAARFGSSVALSGDTLAVGVPEDDIGTNINQGSVYVYVRAVAGSDASWMFQQKLIAGDGERGDQFGLAVALSGSTLVVGAPYGDIKIGNNALANQGTAYVFARIGALWEFGKKLVANDGALGDQFGTSVAINGDFIAVGAPLDDLGTKQDQGAVYLFIGAEARWDFAKKVVAADGIAFAEFGHSVALSSVVTSGDTLVVGAFYDTIGTHAAQGSAYLFTRTGFNNWSQTQKVFAGGGAANDYFGWSVALNSDLLVVGAPGNAAAKGAAYVYQRAGGCGRRNRN
jgi:hypothetical protein